MIPDGRTGAPVPAGLNKSDVSDDADSVKDRASSREEALFFCWLLIA